MTALAIQDVVSSQEALIDALDANDPAAIEAAAALLDTALGELRRIGSPAELGDALPMAMALNQAARVRVNFLTDNNRRQLNAMAAIRGLAAGFTYRPSAR